MSRTRRNYADVMNARRKQQAHPTGCLKRPQTRGQWAALDEARELEREVAELFGLHFRNRDKSRHIANHYDDIPVAAIDESKFQFD